MSDNSEIFIVDNTDNDWKVLRYLRDYCDISKQIDIATGYFEIGSLLALNNEWQKVDKIRILMGDEVSKRTARVIKDSFQKISSKLDSSLENEKVKNDFLSGVHAIVRALKEGKIECRVFKKDKFHAKAYITHSRLEVIGSNALVGSSNFTKPGLIQNIELNVQIRGAEVSLLQSWYDKHWEQAEDCTVGILRVIERHSREYLPYDIWLKSISEFLIGHEATIDEWERNKSHVFPKLAKYQKDGYKALMKRADKYKGALLCDGVGLGKTFVGLMLIERFLMYKGNRKSVALFVPKAAREAVWEAEIIKHIPDALSGFLPFKIFNHTDLHREKLEREFNQVKDQADIIIIDEAHHFRNRGYSGETDFEKRSRYFRMLELTKGKQVFLLTATPINNKLVDLKHLIDLFACEDDSYFSCTLGIHSINGHFRQLDNKLDNLTAELEGSEESADKEINHKIASDVMSHDPLFRELVVQRSRKYVKESVTLENEGALVFPKREVPKVAGYDVKKTFDNLLDKIEDSFSKSDPLFVLSIYNPHSRYIGPEDERDRVLENRYKQVVRLIRIGFLKRFESSAEAFNMSCTTLMFKLLSWIKVNIEKDIDKERLDRWQKRHSDIIQYMNNLKKEFSPNTSGEPPDEDIIPPEFISAMASKKLNSKNFNINAILEDAYEDLDQLSEFLKETQKVTPERDDKLQSLVTLLKNDDTLNKHKVIIFTEFKATARYLAKQLKQIDITGVDVIDSSTSENRSDLIQRFSPYYNNSSSAKLAEENKKEIRVLIATDVLAEGLNLQDCTRLINYDIHWNPVRLMQRIGRIDRRLNPEIEERIIADHPDTVNIRRTVTYWNFIPPGELDTLLRLHKKVSHKTLRISKVLGIEGGKLLKPDDDYDDLKDFDEQYEGKASFNEELHLEFQKLLRNNPELEEQIANYPGKLFSGRLGPINNAKGIFFCYALPAPRELEKGEEIDSAAEQWSTKAGTVEWYYIDINSENITKNSRHIASLIRSKPNTPRKTALGQDKLIEFRKRIEKEIKNSYLKRMNAPVGVKPELRCWMEIN